jgi:hypothetical protein
MAAHRSSLSSLLFWRSIGVESQSWSTGFLALVHHYPLGIVGGDAAVRVSGSLRSALRLELAFE